MVKRLKPPSPKIDTNGKKVKPIIATNWGTGGAQRGPTRAPVSILIDCATVLVIPIYRFCRYFADFTILAHLSTLPFFYHSCDSAPTPTATRITAQLTPI